MTEFFGNIIRILDFQIKRPEAYGWFHITCIILSVAIGVLLCVTHRNSGMERVRRVVIIVAIITMVLEIYKQFNYTFEYENGVITADYRWYAFPWQFCSMPMYVGLLTVIFKRGRVHDALCAFLATYAMFAGACVMVSPGDVFTPTLGISIQTMVCHGSMITVGIYLWYTKYVKAEQKTILKALPVFSSALAIAVILNEIAYYSGLTKTDTFNMFFVSRHCEPSLLVYSSVQEVVPYPFCLFIYIAGFTLAAYVIVLLAIGIQALVSQIKKRKRLA